MAMTRFTYLVHNLSQLVKTLLTLLVDGVHFLGLCLCPSPALAAENLFLRKQLALYQERNVKSRRTTHALRMVLVWLGRWFDWQKTLAVVKPETFIRWHRQEFRLFWRWKSRPGRPRIPVELQALIRQIARDNPTWGQERIANELLWTLHQLRKAIPADHGYRFLIHDRDSIFARAPDRSLHNLGLRVLKTPPQAPQANAICERALGTLRRECLDFVIPLTENHLRHLLHEWVRHYNEGRPHMSLGPGIPRPSASLPASLYEPKHRFPEHLRVVACPVLGGLHHEYRLEAKAA